MERRGSQQGQQHRRTAWRTGEAHLARMGYQQRASEPDGTSRGKHRHQVPRPYRWGQPPRKKCDTGPTHRSRPVETPSRRGAERGVEVSGGFWVWEPVLAPPKKATKEAPRPNPSKIGSDRTALQRRERNLDDENKKPGLAYHEKHNKGCEERKAALDSKYCDLHEAVAELEQSNANSEAAFQAKKKKRDETEQELNSKRWTA